MKKIAGVLLALGMLVGCSHADSSVSAIKVTRVIDGDTIELENGQKVRLLGIDTPERGCPGYREATKNMQNMVLAKRIILVSDGKQSTDRYGRLLRFVEIGKTDVGFEQIKNNYADARYDSTDHYPKHSREAKYHDADKKKNPVCE
jgi:endonuclease YncB( thermonuclease family)